MNSSVDHPRRKFLASAFRASAVLIIAPMTASAAAASPDWVVVLEHKLRSFSSELTRCNSAEGEIELHCAMADPAAFAASHGNLGHLRVRVKARGNRLSMQRDGITVNIFLKVA